MLYFKFALPSEVSDEDLRKLWSIRSEYLILKNRLTPDEDYWEYCKYMRASTGIYIFKDTLYPEEILGGVGLIILKNKTGYLQSIYV